MWPSINKKDLYQESGYFNVAALLDCCMPFNFVIGGRGTGKTFGALYELHERGTKFMFMRRTQGQAEIVANPEFHPYKALNAEMGLNVTAKRMSKFNGGFYEQTQNSEGELVPMGAPFAYTCALSTISNIRGISMSEIEVLLFDEFIPERHERPIKNEGFALMNAYETINRNRETQGRPPLQLLALTNSNDLAPDIFVQLQLVTVIDRMKRKGKTVYQDQDRGVCVVLLDDSPISQAKKDTALYRLTAGTEFSSMSLDNDFSNAFPFVHPRPLVEYKPLVTVGELTVYSHKSNGSLYVSDHLAGGVSERYETDQQSLEVFRMKYHHIYMAYLRGLVEFESAICCVLFDKYV